MTIDEQREVLEECSVCGKQGKMDICLYCKRDVCPDCIQSHPCVKEQP